MSLLRKTSIALDISDHTIEVVELKKSGRGAKIISSNRISLPEGVVVHGRVAEAEKLGEVVKKIFAEATPIPILAQQISFALPDVLVFTHVFKLTDMRKGDIEKVLPSAIAKALPIAREDIVFNERILEKSKDNLEVLVSAVDKDVLKEWASFFKSQKLNISNFDLEPLAIYRSLYKTKQKKAVCIVDIGSRTTNISFFGPHGLTYTQTSHIAGNTFSPAEPEVQEVIEVKTKKKKKVKPKKKGVPPKIELEPLFTTLAGIIAEAISFAEKQRGVEITEIILVGGACQTKGLLEHIKKSIQKPVQTGTSSVVESSKLEFLGAIGVAWRSMHKSWKNDLTLPIVETRKIERGKKKKRMNKEVIEEAKNEPISVSHILEDKEGIDDKKKLWIQLTLLCLIVIVGGGALLWAFSYRTGERSAVEEAKQLALQANIVEQPLLEEEIVVTSTIDIVEEITTSTPKQYVEVIGREGLLVNVRQEPTTASDIVKKVLVGEQYELMATSTKSDWYQILLVDETVTSSGWIFETYIALVDNTTSTLVSDEEV